MPIANRSHKKSNKNRLLGRKGTYRDEKTVVLFQEDYFKNQVENKPSIRVQVGFSKDTAPFLQEILSIIEGIFSMPDDVTTANTNAVVEQLECCLLSVFLLSIRFFPADVICLYLPQSLIKMAEAIALPFKSSICVESTPSCCSCEVTSGFLEQNIVYSSEHSEVYRYSVNSRNYAFKLKADTLTEGSLSLINHGFRLQTIVQKTIFGKNFAAGTSIVCTEYIVGRQFHGMLPHAQADLLIASVLSASNEIRSIQCSDGFFPTIAQKIKACTEAVGNGQVAHLGILIQILWASEASTIPCTQVCLYDLHRDNLVWDQSGWHIIDVDSAVLGTDSFMFSCLLAASFLIEGYSPQFLIRKALTHFPDSCERIAAEVIVRLYIGISFFSQKQEHNSFFLRYIKALACFTREIKRQTSLFQPSFRLVSEHLLCATEAI